jgi:hypothetical protein
MRFGHKLGIGDGALARVDEHQFLPRTMPTQVVNRKIADNAEQPRPDLTLVVGQPLVLEEAQRGLLRQLPNFPFIRCSG